MTRSHVQDSDAQRFHAHLKTVPLAIANACLLCLLAVVDDDQFATAGVIGALCVDIAAGPDTEITLRACGPVEGAMDQSASDALCHPNRW